MDGGRGHGICFADFAVAFKPALAIRQGTGHMGTVEFKGEPPFELTIQGGVTATFLGGNVVVTLPVSGLGSAAQAVEIQVTMTIEQSEQLLQQVPAAKEMATRERWAGR